MEMLERHKHIGQSYTGAIIELVQRVEELEKQLKGGKG